MSKTLHLKDEVSAICERAGLEPNNVANIIITPETVTFDVYDEPRRFDGYGPAMVTVTHPWVWE